MDVQPGMVGQERLHVPPPMDRTTVAEQVDRSAQMAEQVLKERADVEAGEIAGAAPEIERQVPPLGRHRHPAAN